MNSNNITDSAFIADLTVRSPVSGRCDNDLTAEVEAKHKLSGGGRWVKAIYSKEHLAEVSDASLISGIVHEYAADKAEEELAK